MFPDIPKPLIPVMGKPVLEWELLSLRDQGFPVAVGGDDAQVAHGLAREQEVSFFFVFFDCEAAG